MTPSHPALPASLKPRHPGGRPRIVPDDTVRAIRRMAAAGCPYVRIASALGLSRGWVSEVARGVARAEVP